MTRLQLVKVLDQQIDASFKRSASCSIEQKKRAEMRDLQKQLRDAHQNAVQDRELRKAFLNLFCALSEVKR